MTQGTEKKYDPEFVRFFLGEGATRMKHWNLAFKVLLRHRHELLLCLADLEERLLWELLPEQWCTEAANTLFAKAERVLWALNDLAAERYLWLQALLGRLKQGLEKALPPSPSEPELYPLERVCIFLKSRVGHLAAALGEVKNVLKIPVPRGVVLLLSDEESEPTQGSEVERIVASWKQIIIRPSPTSSEGFLSSRTVPTPQWRQALKALRQGPGKEVFLLLEAPPARLSGLFCPPHPQISEEPCFLVRQNEGYQIVPEEDFPGPPEAAYLIRSYAENISFHFGTPHTLEWTLSRQGQVFICGLWSLPVPRILKSSWGKHLRKHRLGLSPELLARLPAPLRSLWEKLVPFTMLLPESEDLAVVSKPTDFQTLQDVVTFAHEAAVRELFRLEEKGALHLLRDPRLPIAFYLLDLGQGLRPQATFRREISISDVRSRPLHVLWRGMTHEGVHWKGPVEFNLGGFFSVLSRSFVQGSISREGGKGYLLLTRDYFYLRLRLAFHLMVVEALFRDQGESFLLFRLQGGGAGASGRQQRFLLLRDILRALDFRVEIAGDLIQALYLAPLGPELEERLDQLGRLLGFTRQLDMTLRDENTRQRYVEAFLKGYYSLLENPEEAD